MRVNQEGMLLIRQAEGCRLKAYRCEAGVLTIGFGHTGKDVFEGMEITPDTAELVLESDVRRAADGLAPFVRRPVGPNQWSAMVSLAFNVGAQRLGKSTLVRMVNEGDLAQFGLSGEVTGGAAYQFLAWHYINGKPSVGLLRRRHAEMRLFLRGLPSVSQPPRVG